MSGKLAAFGAALAMMGGITAAGASEIAASVEIIEGAVAIPLTSMPGDAASGKQTFINRTLGNCLACHEVTELSDHPFHGRVGPSLDGVADRYSEAELRAIIVDSKSVFEDTIMPAFYRTEGFNRVGKKFAGKPILQAQQVEDVLAYLKTLKE